MPLDTTKLVTMYGLSLTANLVFASATSRLASAIAMRRSMSSEPAAGVPKPEADVVGVAGVGPAEMLGEGVTA